MENKSKKKEKKVVSYKREDVAVTNKVEKKDKPEPFKVPVRVKYPVYLIQEDVTVTEGNGFYVTDEKRLKTLLGKNEYKAAFVEVIESEEEREAIEKKGLWLWTEKK